MNRRDKQRIALKDKQWESDIDVFFDKLRILLPKWWKKLKKTMKHIFNWYFFFTGKDKALHLFEWCLVTAVILRFFGLI